MPSNEEALVNGAGNSYIVHGDGITIIQTGYDGSNYQIENKGITGLQSTVDLLYF